MCENTDDPSMEPFRGTAGTDSRILATVPRAARDDSATFRPEIKDGYLLSDSKSSSRRVLADSTCNVVPFSPPSSLGGRIVANVGKHRFAGCRHCSTLLQAHGKVFVHG
ncbi:hypothetical protein DACRYDRAFT_19525 [Dacryopinax primogenitus]|uniref:Uncharacterized protein n=1 Tax=Dacryopinax primogenitus (strain DJM 731) TaxID=1858805 RepID=M5GBH7_DACPD|nr:uncharacterized protein DACRYDRAFT_19525 [Dacryopinax primogenitus]EJU06314.1 hypothetical protein DACRYDRAFT_19525 [Dacryopinax primogenitus]